MSRYDCFTGYDFPNIMNLINYVCQEQEKRKQEEKLLNAGVVFNEAFGVPTKNIPSVYSRIDFIHGRFYVCDKIEENILKSDVFDEEGTFLFTSYGNSIEYLGYGEMFLFKDPKEGEKDKIHHSLFFSNGDEYVTEGAIYRPHCSSKFKKDSEFCIIGNAVTCGVLVINKSGEIIYESKSFDSVYLYNNVLYAGRSFINLLNNEVICDDAYSKTLETGNLKFVESNGQVFKIDTITGEYEVFGKSTKIQPISPPKPTSPPAPKEKKPVAPKQSRNDLCNCGSGKKFKNCCGK